MELAKAFQMSRDITRRFADAARLLLCGNGDLASLAIDLQTVLEEYDDVNLGEYNKIVRLSNELPEPLRDKYSSSGSDESGSWNFGE
jgi:hypothetical protein